jgi:hypothetical protein
MPNKGMLARCPFYMSDEKLSVTCEGPDPGGRIVHAFRSAAQKNGWTQKRCCAFGYSACPIFRAVNEMKYGGSK